MQNPAPIFILSSPHSYASLLASMLGNHPSGFGVPELNLLISHTLIDVFDNLPPKKMDGFLRVISYIFSGEQTVESLEMARRWVFKNSNLTISEIYNLLLIKLQPKTIIEPNSLYSDPENSPALYRLMEVFPNARYIHLIRHPVAQCLSWLKSPFGLMELVKLRSCDPGSSKLLPDPQFDWYRRNMAIQTFLEEVSTQNKICILAEDFLTNAPNILKNICAWLDFEYNMDALNKMLAPETSPFSKPGPYGAEGGFEQSFLASPKYSPSYSGQSYSLDISLPWRPDGSTFSSSLINLAKKFGYN